MGRYRVAHFLHGSLCRNGGDRGIHQPRFAFAFIVVLGILVDDAIVVGESVYTLGSKGKKPLLASIEGTHLVAVPVTFAILTSMVAFVPMLFFPGGLGN